MRRRHANFWTGLSVHLTRRGAASQLPSPLESWLTPCELDELSLFRAPSRRGDWISGRWCAKQLLHQTTIEDVGSYKQWQILSRQSMTRGCPPAVFRNGIKQSKTLSLAHCDSITIAVAADHHVGRIGVDAVNRTRLPGSFATTWFSSRERSLLQGSRWTAAAAWAAKEAVFKACNDGESFRPGRLRIDDVNDTGCSVQYESKCLAAVRLNRLADAFVAVARMTNNDPDGQTHSVGSGSTKRMMAPIEHDTEHAA